MLVNVLASTNIQELLTSCRLNARSSFLIKPETRLLHKAMANTTPEDWAATAASYADNIARATTAIAEIMVPLAATQHPMDASSRVLDVGAGTGAVTLAVVKHSSAQVLATDVSPAMLSHLAARAPPNNVHTQTIDACALSSSLSSSSFSHVFCAFVLHTLSDAAAAAREMHAMLKPGGLVAVAAWDNRNACHGPFLVWNTAARRVDPTYTLPAAFQGDGQWGSPEGIAEGLITAGFKDVSVSEQFTTLPFENGEAFAEFWFGARNPAALQCLSGFRGSLARVREQVVRIVDEEFQSGKGIPMPAFIAFARKVA